MSEGIRKFSRQAIIDPEGNLMVSAAQYSKATVLACFEMIGGVSKFAEWAENNQDDFYTKIYTKLISNSVEHSGPNGGPVEFANMSQQEIDREIELLSEQLAIDGEFELVEEGDE